MKSNLILAQYQTTPVIGTFSTLEDKTFLGSKMLEIEDSIIIDTSYIQYSQFTGNTDNLGYQYYIQDLVKESLSVLDLTTLKSDNHTINTDSQSDADYQNNTRWILNIDIKDILKQYLFAKIKENRTFRCIYFNDFTNKNINSSILEYIENNVLNRYKFTNIDFYVKYYEILINQNIYSQSFIKYNPKFDKNLRIDSNIIKTVSVKNYDNILTATNVTVSYNQTKPATQYKFDYYFDLNFVRI